MLHGELVDIFMMTWHTIRHAPEADYSRLIHKFKYTSTHTHTTALINKLCSADLQRRRIKRDRLCGLLVRVPGCSPRGPGFDSWSYQIFCVAVDLERGPLSPCEDK
jgi:hypothetical protein